MTVLGEGGEKSVSQSLPAPIEKELIAQLRKQILRQIFPLFREHL